MTTRKVITEELYRLRRRPQPRIPPVPWAVRAACQGHDPELWANDQPGLATATAKVVCAAPVRAACLAHALRYDEPGGIWGGLTARERVAGRLGVSLDADESRPYMSATGPRKTKPQRVANGA